MEPLVVDYPSFIPHKQINNNTKKIITPTPTPTPTHYHYYSYDYPHHQIVAPFSTNMLVSTQHANAKTHQYNKMVMLMHGGGGGGLFIPSPTPTPTTNNNNTKNITTNCKSFPPPIMSLRRPYGGQHQLHPPLPPYQPPLRRSQSLYPPLPLSRKTPTKTKIPLKKENSSSSSNNNHIVGLNPGKVGGIKYSKGRKESQSNRPNETQAEAEAGRVIRKSSGIEIVFSMAPPPSSLPLPSFSLTKPSSPHPS